MGLDAGMSIRLFDECVAYAQERNTFGHIDPASGNSPQTGRYVGAH